MMVRSPDSGKCQHRKRLGWPVIGLLVVLAMFGHDLLMTASVSAKPLDASVAIAADAHDHNAAQALPHVEDRSRSSDPALPHSDWDCGVDAAIARLLVSPTAAGAPLAVAEIDPPALMSPGESPPDGGPTVTVPPAVRRALLQVYLI